MYRKYTERVSWRALQGFLGTDRCILSVFSFARGAERIIFLEDIIIKDLQINHDIRDKEVRLIDETGTQLGIVPLAQAQQLADEKEMDLVKISPQAVPPVCKIMDYGKYRFEAIKKEKEARKNQKVQEMKEMRLSMTIDSHDVEVKAKQVRKFLQDGNKVKVSIRMRGRQMAHSNLGLEVMNEFADILKDVSSPERKPFTEGRNIIMILAPLK